MNIRKNVFSFLFLVILFGIFFQACGKKDEPQTFFPPNQDSTIDLEKQKKEMEEFERLKKLQSGDSSALKDSMTMTIDTSNTGADTVKTVPKKDKKKFVQKEKELNKRLDNPKVTITDYIEFLKRGTSEGGDFEQNMKKASQLWEGSNLGRFKANYKNTKKITVLEEPKVVSQKGNTAVVEVKLKKTDVKNNVTEDVEMTVKYNLVADSKGKWKIKNNVVVRK